jgi:hypothetical protein
MTTTKGPAASPSSTSKAATTKYTDATGAAIPDEALDAPDHQTRPLTEQQRAIVNERVAALKKHKPQ